MKVNKINSVNNNYFISSNIQKKTNFMNQENSVPLSGLQTLGVYNQINFKGNDKKFEIGLSSEELAMRTSDEVNTNYKLLDVDAPEFLALQFADRQALAHLVKAAVILDDVALIQDNPHNIEFRDYLIEETEKGNIDAKNALQIFTSQKGINGIDNKMNKVQLAKGVEETLGGGFYPEDLEVEEFHNILNKMLDDGETEEVANILNQRSIVVRDGDKLKAVDYTKYFEKEFETAARELEKAAQVSSNDLFNEFLVHQALALLGKYPLEDAYADKYWADMQNTPLEFTITRENYDDNMTKTVPENEELMQRLNKHGIEVIPKDSIGVRVGIVNEEGTDRLLGIKKHLPKIAEKLPHQDLYVQSVNNKHSKQTMVDADLVYLSGDSASIRAGVVTAENLPNSDKLSLKMGGGRRNVYHRQVRMYKDNATLKTKLNHLLTPEQHKYYDSEAIHKFIIGHENMHSLGPNKNAELGKYTDVFEELKADMGSFANIDTLVEEGFYTPEERKEIIVTAVVNNGLKSMPKLSQTHRTCDVMEFNYLYQHGAFEMNTEGIITVDFDKAEKAAKDMLDEIIFIQATGDIDKAEKFVSDYFYWDIENELFADNLNKISKKLTGKFTHPLADELLKKV